MYLPWGSRIFDCLDFEDGNRFWKYVGKNWTVEMEDATEEFYREVRSIRGDITEAEFFNDIVKDFIAEVEVGNPKGARAFIDRINEQKLGLGEIEP